MAYSTLDSQAVSDPSTKRAQRCLTWLIGREAVFSTWYGRKRNNLVMTRCSDNQIRAMLRSLFLGLDTTMANRPKLNTGPENMVTGPENMVTGPENTVTGPEHMVTGPENMVTGGQGHRLN